jgi:hypothetical protein
MNSFIRRIQACLPRTSPSNDHMPVWITSVTTKEFPLGIENQKNVFCDGRRIIKRGLCKNSFLQLQIYWLQGLRPVRTG